MVKETLLCVGVMSSLFKGRSIESNSMTWFLNQWDPHVSKNKDLVIDAQTLLQESLFEKKYVEFERKLIIQGLFHNFLNLSPFSESKYI